MTEQGLAPRMSDDAVRAKTGKTWPEWFALLDAAGGADMSHKEIVAHLHGAHGLGPWWGQMVTVTYEQARGLRDRHQTPEGYQVSGSRTIAAPLSVLYRAWTSDAERARWLPDGALTISKATPEKSVRGAWAGGGRVEANFYAKGDAKSQVAMEHTRLASAADAARMKAYWAERLDALREQLEGGRH